MPILRPHAVRSCVRESKGNRCERRAGGGALADSSHFRASGGAKFKNMGGSLPWTPMNHRTTFDADSFILGGEKDRNRTN